MLGIYTPLTKDLLVGDGTRGGKRRGWHRRVPESSSKFKSGLLGRRKVDIFYLTVSYWIDNF